MLGGNLVFKEVFLKGQSGGERCVRLPLNLLQIVLPPPKACQLALQRSLSRLPMVGRQVCIQHMRNGGLGMPDLESHWFAKRLAYLGRSLTGDAVWRRKTSRTFPRLQSDPKAEVRRKPTGEALFVRECRAAIRNLPGSSDLSQPRKELYRELVVGSALDPLSEQFGWTAGEIRSHWNWAPWSSFFNNSEFSLTWRLARNALPPSRLELQNGPGRHARLCSLQQWFRRNSWGRLLLRASLPVLGSRRGVDDSHWTKAARAARRWLRRGQRSTSVIGEKLVVFLAILAVARMVIWTTQKGGLYDNANFSSWSGLVF